ncbi:MAG: hypothetical protein FJ280_22965, partial [Planctomycetes bacterium]|nr:hypothetical protein [Planctomycetota bacterium]
MSGHMKLLLVMAPVLAAAAGVFAGDWPGFHGGEREGRGDSPAGPLHWSAAQNVVWKTAIPGRGHSSPVVSDEAVYLATTYESLQASAAPRVWHYATYALTCLLTVAGVSLALRSVATGGARRDRVWQHARFFLFALLLTTVVVVVLFGRRLLDWDGSAARFGPISVV